MVQMIGTKLLTEGNNILTIGSSPIMLNSLKIMNMKKNKYWTPNNISLILKC
jgi:hypothetical protein